MFFCLLCRNISTLRDIVLYPIQFLQVVTLREANFFLVYAQLRCAMGLVTLRNRRLLFCVDQGHEHYQKSNTSWSAASELHVYVATTYCRQYVVKVAHLMEGIEILCLLRGAHFWTNDTGNRHNRNLHRWIIVER